MKTITLSPQEHQELQQPYSAMDALSAIKLGFALGLSEIGITPSEFEGMVKFAEFNNPLGVGVGLLESLGKATLAGGAVGTLVGGYSGYLRHRAEKAIEGKNDPDIMALRNKIRAYDQMKKDLLRTNAVTA